jgi:hypothetical protein
MLRAPAIRIAVVVGLAVLAGATGHPAASELVLPASPRDVAAGDVDGDGSAELVLLVEWPEWSSIARQRPAAPGVFELDVVPAIEVRRELWVLRPASGRLEQAVPPLAVGPRVVAIDGAGGDGRVVALTDEGPAWLNVETEPAGATGVSRLALELVAAIDTPLARSERVLTRARLLADVDGDGTPSITVPTGTGWALVGSEGEVTRFVSAYREVRSGAQGRLRMSLPRLVDLDRDGTPERMELDGGTGEVVWKPRRPDGSYGPGLRWDAERIRQDAQRHLYGEDGEVERHPTLVLTHRGDVDNDGTLELTLGRRLIDAEDRGLGDALDDLRGKSDILVTMHALGWDGTVSDEPERSFTIRGHPLYVRRGDGTASPFVDLEGDGRAELLTVRIRIGMFGIARSVMSGEASPKVELGGYRWDGKGWEAVTGGMPEVRYRLDLGSGELSQYARIPGDVDGDGVHDLVEIDERSVRVYPGLVSQRSLFADEPAREYRLMDPIRSWLGAEFLDLDGDGDLELLAFEPFARGDDEEMVDPVRVELLSLRAEEGP